MEENLLPFGPGALCFIGLYLLSLIVIGWLGHRARESNSMKDFYLGGSGIGFLVLFMTLYATQYSGNTLFGFSGKAYRIGYSWLTCVHFMIAIIVGYLLFAPRLHRLSRSGGYITPTDFLRERYQSRGLNMLAPLVMIAALANYLLAQLTAMGRALQGLTSAPPDTAFIFGVLLLAVIMVVYETMGGFRAVAWTDVIQGIMLLCGIAALTFMVFQQFGSLGSATATLLAGDAVDRAKVLPPDAYACRNWLSYVLLFGLGASLYPQAIQRIYAAKSSRALRNSLALMAFMPLVTALFAVVIGVIGAAHISGLQGSSSDRILTVICREIQESSVLGYWLVALLFAAILAALMSTADSCLLTISSMATRDVYQRFLHPDAREARLTRVGKVLSWLVLALMATLAIHLNSLDTKPTLVRLLDMKFDMLVQLVPAFMIGIHWKFLRGDPVFLGMAAGLGVTFALYGNETIQATGFHNGLYGLLVNLAVAIGGSWIQQRRSSSHEPATS